MNRAVLTAGILALLAGAVETSVGPQVASSIGWQATGIAGAADLDQRPSSRRQVNSEEESTAHVGDTPLELRIEDGPLVPPSPPPDETDHAALALPLPAPDDGDCDANECDGEFPRAPHARHAQQSPRTTSRINDLFGAASRGNCSGGVCEAPRPVRSKNVERLGEVPTTGRRTRTARRAVTTTADSQRSAVHRAADESAAATDSNLNTDANSNLAGAGGSAGGVTVDWLTPREVNLGEAVTCQLVVHNRSAADAQDVRVTVALPQDVRFEGADPEALEDHDTLVWHIGRMGGEQSETILVRLSPQTEGAFSPQAAVTFTQASAAEIRVAQPELSIEMSGPNQASVGEGAKYQFHVTNRGQGAAVNVVVHAKVDPSFEHPQGTRVEYRLGMLAPAETRTVEAVLAGREPGEFELLAAVTAGDHILARAGHTVRIARPRLELALEGPGRRFVDRKANYLVEIHNPGPAVAENVHVTQSVPEGFRFVQATPGGSYDAKLRQVGWFVGRLEPEESAEVGLQLIPTEVGEHVLAAEVQADAGVIGSAELATRVDGVSAVVLEVQDMDDPVEVSGQTVYQLRVSNHGSIPARHVQVGARVPAQLRITDAAGPSAANVQASQVEFEPLDRLAPGEARVFHVHVECLTSGQATFRGFVRSDDQDQPTTVEELTRVYED